MVPETEHLPSPEQRRASPGLMLHIAHGEFDKAQTGQLSKTPEEISQHTFDVLERRHMDERKQQQKQHDASAKKRLVEELGWPEDKITPDLLRHMHMKDWAQIEATKIRYMLAADRENSSVLQEKIAALKKLHLIIDENVDAASFPDQLYATTSNTTGVPGKFYQEFCIGNTNQKLINTLSEQELLLLQPFLTDVVGSYDAFDALLATKQTQDALLTKHDFSNDTVSLTPNDERVLDFFRGTRPLREQEPPVPQSTGAATEANPEHPDRNDDTYFIDTQHLRGGIFDGAGGYSGGDKASRAAQEAVQQSMTTVSPNASEQEVREKLTEALAAAQDAVRRVQQETGNTQAATTAAIFQVVETPDGEKKLLVANVGDSRVWVRHADGTIALVSRDGGNLRNMYRGRIQKATTDSERETETSTYNELAIGLDSAAGKEDLAANPMLAILWQKRNETNLLGSDSPVEETGEIFELPLLPGDTIFLTTDGVHDNLTLDEIRQIASQAHNPQQLSDMLVAHAKDVSGNNSFRSKSDDITAAALSL